MRNMQKLPITIGIDPAAGNDVSVVHQTAYQLEEMLKRAHILLVSHLHENPCKKRAGVVGLRLRAPTSCCMSAPMQEGRKGRKIENPITDALFSSAHYEPYRSPTGYKGKAKSCG
ncbi:hypothetical protein OX886_23625 [Serratia marcescens]|uniref:hypothetical protein n=1 Tax=Serratia marcescens TaxID=615 RepID=UPI0009A4E3A7|nr:hypothetical protein [Serratia marcescens]OPJ97324.1 hypothetical protein B1H39_02105 [Serratia marcescens]CAI1547910.1 Uncharacterised protein [Serratia marcescens]